MTIVIGGLHPNNAMKILSDFLHKANNLSLFILTERGNINDVVSFIIVFRLVRDVVANHKITRYAGVATKVIQKKSPYLSIM